MIGKGLSMRDFLEIFLKNFFLFISSVYCIIKMLPHHSVITRKRCIAILFFACVVSIGIFVTNCYIPQVNIIVMIVASIFIYLYLFKVNINTAIIITMIGYGVSYLAYALAALILTFFMFSYQKITLKSSGILPYIAVGPIQFLLVLLLFRVRRFRRGIPVLNYEKYGDAGVCLSIIVVIAISILSLNDHTTIIIPIIVCMLFMCGLALFCWWKNRITQNYLTQLHQREKQALQEEIDILQKKLVDLKEDHDRLSRVVHKDNKLIPAMELAVSQLLCSIFRGENQRIRIEQAQSILEQLKSLSCERAGIIKNYEYVNQKLPLLGIGGWDALLHFMMHKARMAGIAFDFKMEEDVCQKIIQIISEQDATTLLADLIENALISASNSQNEKAIQVELGIHAGVCCICVRDSGDPFPKEVLERWGVERITTHQDTGGSGIGMMTLYELCQKYHASFEIEQSQNMSPYHKCISVRYDGQGSFKVR